MKSFFVMCLLGISVSVAHAEAPGPVQVVQQFNQAVSARDMDAAMPLLAEGSIQFSLRVAHSGMGLKGGLTEDLRKTWTTVASILFPATESYQRTVEVISTETHGDIATVWTNTRTVNVQKNKPGEMRQEFTEMWLLVRQNDKWLIAGIANNRAANAVTVK